MTRPLRVLVLIQGPLGNRLTGPEIRGWEIARAFAARGHSVTAAASVEAPTTREGIPVVPRARRSVVKQLRRHDVVVGPVIPPYALIAGRRCLRVADLYDPVELELATIGGWRAERHVAQQRGSRRLQQRWAEIIVCANERQRERLLLDLDNLHRPGGPPAVLTVPMGLPDAPEPVTGHALRDKFPEIGADDPLVLWWGSVWRWLDAGTVVEAIGQLAKRVPEIRLVITAGKPANSATDALNVAEDVREQARDRGLLDRNVFFLDEWVPFDERHRFLGDADVGVTLHAATPEATLAARARYMDYVWASVPSVLAEGDEVADELAAVGAARLVPPHDPAATAAALEALIDDPAARAAARAACEALAAKYQWSKLVSPLVDRVEATEPVRRGLGQTAAIALQAGRYYARRLVDRGLSAIPAR
jgi:glycosyltransferase involved in cell wall biosynthesis